MKCLLKRRRESRLGFKIIQTGGEGIVTREGLGVRVLQLRDGKFITLFDFLKIFTYLAVSSCGCVTWDLSLQSTNSLLMWAQQLWHMGFGAPWQMPSQFPCQESNPYPPHWKAGYEPLDHQGCPHKWLSLCVCSLKLCPDLDA